MGLLHIGSLREERPALNKFEVMASSTTPSTPLLAVNLGLLSSFVLLMTLPAASASLTPTSRQPRRLPSHQSSVLCSPLNPSNPFKLQLNRSHSLNFSQTQGSLLISLPRVTWRQPTSRNLSSTCLQQEARVFLVAEMRRKCCGLIQVPLARFRALRSAAAVPYSSCHFIISCDERPSDGPMNNQASSIAYFVARAL